MRDRKSKHPGRFKFTIVEQGDGYFIGEMTRADEPETEGTRLASFTLLPDSVAEALGLEPAEATPADAFMLLAENIKPEIEGISVAETDLANTVEFTYSDGTKDTIESTFGSEGELRSLTVNGRSIAVVWGQSGGGSV